MKSAAIIKQAKDRLSEIIVDYLRRYDAFLQTGKKRLKSTGEVNLYDEDFNSEMPTIEIEVDNSYLDVYDTCTEKRSITQFIVEENGDLCFCVAGADADYDITPKNMTVEELARIANFLQNEYETL
jgi:hypothetical protein